MIGLFRMQPFPLIFIKISPKPSFAISSEIMAYGSGLYRIFWVVWQICALKSTQTYLWIIKSERPPSVAISLVSTYVVCERLYVMQGLPECGWHGEIFAHFGKNTKNTTHPPTPEMKKWPDLGTLSFELARIPSLPENWNLGRSWHFEFWLLQNPHQPQKIEI